MVVVTLEAGQHLDIPPGMAVTTSIEILSVNADGSVTIGLSSPDFRSAEALH